MAEQSIPQILAIAAQTAEALEARIEEVAQSLRKADADLSEIAAVLAASTSGNHRAFVVANSPLEAAAALTGETKGLSKGFAAEQQPALAFLFSGVGDHYVQMTAGLYRTFPTFKAVIDRCCSAFEALHGEDLLKVLFPPASKDDPKPANDGKIDLRAMLRAKLMAENATAQKLNQPAFTHPAIFSVEYALCTLLKEWGIEPDMLLGYSMGEYVAATVAGVLQPIEALDLVSKRARLIDEQPRGVMLAVPVPEAELLPILSDGVSLAITSGPQHSVVGGSEEAIAKFEAILKAKMIISRRLPNTHAVHTPTMDGLKDKLTELLRNAHLSEPNVAYVSNVTGKQVSAQQATDPDFWVAHTTGTVRFADGLHTILSNPHSTLVEVGPGSSLGSFAYQHPTFEPGGNTQILACVRDRSYRGSDSAFLLETVGKLWLAGAPVQLENLVAPIAISTSQV